MLESLEDQLFRYLDDAPGASRTFSWEPSSYALHADQGSGKDLPWPRSSPSASPLRLRVSMERPPLQVGDPPSWTWHKNCTLPRIAVEVWRGDGGPLPERAAVLLSAVTLDVASEAATSCGLEGSTLLPLVSGRASFSALTFKTTSYNLKGRQMHLMATLLVPRAEADPSPPATATATALLAPPLESDAVVAVALPPAVPLSWTMSIAAALVSPPIRVDARKRQPKERGGGKASSSATGAGGARVDGSAGTAATCMPFAPEMLERRMEKVDKGAVRRQIDNSIDGLRAYLSAVNIRNKCKHPLFLVLRFDSCVGLLYDSSRAAHPACLADDTAFDKMMSVLTASQDRPLRMDAYPQPEPQDADKALPSYLPEYVIAIKSDQVGPQHDCGFADCPVRLSAALSLPHFTALPSAYTMMTPQQLGILRRTYCRLHCAHSLASSTPTVSAIPVAALSYHSAAPPPFQHCNACQAPPDPHGPDGLIASHETEHMLSPWNRATGRTYGTASFHAQGVRLLSSLRESIRGSLGSCSRGCPEEEWERTLAVLASAMSHHCTSSGVTAAELVAFARAGGYGTSGYVTADDPSRKRVATQVPALPSAGGDCGAGAVAGKAGRGGSGGSGGGGGGGGPADASSSSLPSSGTGSSSGGLVPPAFAAAFAPAFVQAAPLAAPFGEAGLAPSWSGLTSHGHGTPMECDELAHSWGDSFFSTDGNEHSHGPV